LQQEGAPLRDGWLLTGDLGKVAVDGSLVLQGRKKELIKTSYGKYVQLTKVEALLRGIPGVAEAMVVGEQKPFCAAILWTQGSAQDLDLLRAIDQAILQVNARLAHPEQVKRWAILPNDLSIERGDLTACLKLKRHSVAQRLQAVVEALYATSKASTLDKASPALAKSVSGEGAGTAKASAQVVYPMHLGQAQHSEAA
jgi:long-chain acyl-CoA synthetase